MEKLTKLIKWMIERRLLVVGDKLKLRHKDKFIYIYITKREV